MSNARSHKRSESLVVKPPKAKRASAGGSLRKPPPKKGPAKKPLPGRKTVEADTRIPIATTGYLVNQLITTMDKKPSDFIPKSSVGGQPKETHQSKTKIPKKPSVKKSQRAKK